MKRIAALLTCHNRREKTLSCLNALFSSRLSERATVEVFLVDDGSIDGTSAAVGVSYSSVHIINGTGNLFWNGGMRLALSHAIDRGFDGYLLLNDDAILLNDGLEKMFRTWARLSQGAATGVIVVGSTISPSTGQISYGGRIRKSRFRPLRFELAQPGEQPRRCDTMNGNCVLIPDNVIKQLGNLDPAFVHSMGDLDLGLRAGAMGIELWVAPGFVAECEVNSPVIQCSMTVEARIRQLRRTLHSKILPPRPWWIFTQRHGGLLGPILWLWPYVKALKKSRNI